MKNYLGKFAVLATLFMLNLTSCKKDETLTGDPNSYTTFEVFNVAKVNTLIKVDGRIGEKLVSNNIIPKMTITRTDAKGTKAQVYTQLNADVTKAPAGLTFTAPAPYGKLTNNVYGFSLSFPAAILVGVTAATSITIDIWDATKVVATFTTTNSDYNIKLQ